MSTFEYLFQFETENGGALFSKCNYTQSVIGASVTAYRVFEDLVENRNTKMATVAKARRRFYI
jgi:hypothetical protein